MIIVTQSGYERYETRLVRLFPLYSLLSLLTTPLQSCNGSPIVWDLRDPTRGFLAAAALALAGVVPSHISYSEARKQATQVTRRHLQDVVAERFFDIYRNGSGLWERARSRTQARLAA